MSWNIVSPAPYKDTRLFDRRGQTGYFFRQCHAFLQPATEKAVFPAPADEAVHEDDGENADDPANASAGCHVI